MLDSSARPVHPGASSAAGAHCGSGKKFPQCTVRQLGLKPCSIGKSSLMNYLQQHVRQEWRSSGGYHFES
jgi:hypothetical protein